jgi:hypothetical protein
MKGSEKVGGGGGGDSNSNGSGDDGNTTAQQQHNGDSDEGDGRCDGHVTATTVMEGATAMHAVSPLFNLGTQHDGRSARTWMKRV